MPARKHYLAAAVLAAVATAGPAAGSASAGVFLCVPVTAGAAVTSGGTAGSCASGTPVELPSSRTDQQTLLSVLPYLSFNAAGVGGKPTIQIKGANLQLINGAGATQSINGTGNLVLGYNEAPGQQTGSHSIVMGMNQSFTGYGNLLTGTNNKASSAWSVVFGYANTGSGAYGTVTGGNNNVAKAAFASVLGGNQNTADGQWATVTGGKGIIVSRYNDTADGTHYWVRMDASATKLADSGTLRGGNTIQTYNYGGGWKLAWFPGLNVAKCSVSVEPDAPDATIGYRYLTSEYVYVRVDRAGQPYDGAGLSVSLDCNNPTT